MSPTNVVHLIISGPTGILHGDGPERLVLREVCNFRGRRLFFQVVWVGLAPDAPVTWSKIVSPDNRALALRTYCDQVLELSLSEEADEEDETQEQEQESAPLSCPSAL